MSTRVFSRETKRAAPIKGGTMKCPHCANERLPGTAYCRQHKQEYDRKWRKRRADMLRLLLSIQEQRA